MNPLQINSIIQQEPDFVNYAVHDLPVGRVDEATAASATQVLHASCAGSTAHWT